MKYKHTLKFAIVSIILITSIGCRSKSYQGKVKLGEDGKIVSGTTIQKCTPPQKRYAKNLEIKVKTKVDSLLQIPISELDLGVTQTITRLSDYTSEGLDFDLFYFRICEMANNRGLSKEQTNSLLLTLMDKWNTNQELKKKLNN